MQEDEATSQGEAKPGRPDVFISYAREDQDFVRRLHRALVARGRQTWVDWEGIPPTAEWMAEVKGAIDATDSFIFVLSPHSAASRVCREEVEHAEAQGKRVVPIVREEPDGEVPEAVGARNWIFFREAHDFEASTDTLLRALDTDLEWARSHTRLLVRAREWEEEGRDRSLLLRGRDLEAAERWLGEAARHPEPRATALHTDYVLASRQAATRGQRLRLGAVAAALVVSLGLAAFAFLQRNEAVRQRGRAEREGRVALARQLAAAAVANLEEDPERSILLSLEAVDATRSVDGTVLPEAEEALHRSVLASRIVRSVSGVGGWLDWSPDGTRFVTEGPEESGVVDIKDAETGESLLSFHGHDVDVNGVAFSADGSMLTTTGDDGAMRVWDAKSGERRANLLGPEGAVHGPSFSPDGSLAAAAWLFEGEVRVWNLGTGRLVHTFDSLPEPWATSFSPDGRRLAIAALEPPATVVVDIGSGKEVFTLQGQESGIHDVDWSPDGRWIATSSNDDTVRIWDARTGSGEFTLFGHTGSVNTADWSPDGGRLVTGAADGTAKVWEIAEGGARELLSLSAQDTRAGVQGVAFSPDGERIMTGDSQIRAVKIWDVSDTGDAEWANVPANPEFVSSADFSRDGRLVTTFQDGSVAVWDSVTGRRLGTIDRSGRPDEIYRIDVSPDGTLVAAAASQTAEVWDIATGHEVFTVRSEGSLEAVAWSPDGEVLAIAGFGEHGTRVVDRSGQQRTVLPDEPGRDVAALGFSADGRLLATAVVEEERDEPTNEQVRVWDWERGAVLKTIKTPVETIAFDPQRGRIAIGNPGGVEIWDLDTGEKVATLGGGTGLVWDVAFSPDGSLIAAAALDETVRVWDAHSRVQVLVLHGHEDVVWDVAFSPDGSRLASGSTDGTVRVWALDLDDLIAIAEDELTRGLTQAECRQYLHQPCP